MKQSSRSFWHTKFKKIYSNKLKVLKTIFWPQINIPLYLDKNKIPAPPTIKNVIEITYVGGKSITRAVINPSVTLLTPIKIFLAKKRSIPLAFSLNKGGRISNVVVKRGPINKMELVIQHARMNL